MNNLCRLCLSFSNELFKNSLEIESKYSESSPTMIPEVLKQLLLNSKTSFFESLKAEKCETNLEYLEALEAIVTNIQHIIYWLGLLKNQEIIDSQNFELLNQKGEEIKFIAQSNIKKISDFMRNPEFYINYDEV